MEYWNNGMMGFKNEKADLVFTFIKIYPPIIPIFHHSNIPTRVLRRRTLWLTNLNFLISEKV
jgi:hypothetical protein